jgi:hypothetical protein
LEAWWDSPRSVETESLIAVREKTRRLVEFLTASDEESEAESEEESEEESD